jgi:hypothetical protein
MAIAAAEDQPRRSSLLRIVVLVFVLNLISAALFIARVNRPVYDDGFNIFDVHTYAVHGFSLNALRSQRNAPGPTSFLWMASAVRLFGGNELRDARIGALFSWLLLGACMLFGARFSRYPELWHGALLASLVFPHSVMAAATVLTEGPALFFALLGALAWTEFVSRADSRPVLALGLLGCLFLGLAATCRQYNLALLPAAALSAAVPLWAKAWSPGQRTLFVGRALASLAVSAVPVLLLFMAWKGVASPSMESGASYNMMYKASASLNPLRPVIALLRVGVYLVPLTFPLMAKVKPRPRWPMLAIAALGGVAAGHWVKSLLQPGPVHSFVRATGRTPLGREIVFGGIALVAIYNALALGLALWEHRTFLLSSAPVAFSLVVIVFFLGEQVAVGGNISFYDRYVLQVAPFLGAVAFAILPPLHRGRLFALATLSLLSQFMLWRFAFGG